MLRVLTAALVIFGVVTSALAQTSPEDAPPDAPKDDAIAEADAAFAAAKKLMAAEKYQAACKKFEQSQSLAPGSGTLLNLGDCYERIGRTASAWASFRAATALARSRGKTAFAEEGIARSTALETRLSRLRIVVPEAARVEGLVIQRGDIAVEPASFGVAGPIDPGIVIVRAEAPGRVAWSTSVTIPKTPGVIEVEVPTLSPINVEPDPRPPSPAPTSILAPSSPVPSDPVPSNLAPPNPAPSTSGLGQQIAGGVVGGVGLVGVGVGIFFGIRALRLKDDSNAEGFCNPDNFCTQDGLETRDDALQSAHASTGLLVAGAALVGTGLIVFLTAPSGQTPPSGESAGPSVGTWQLQLGPHGGGLRATW